MKQHITFSTLTRLMTVALMLAISGCATQDSITAPAPTAEGYETMFENALKAMNKMGRVEISNRDLGIISGITPSGVTLEVEILREQGKAPQLQVQAKVPDGLVGLGEINEPDRYLDIYRRFAGR